jgi:glutamate racemase
MRNIELRNIELKKIKSTVLFLVIALLFAGCISKNGSIDNFIEMVANGESTLFYIAEYEKDKEEYPIGIFDSGIGGLTVLEEILCLDSYQNSNYEIGRDGIKDFENEFFIYFGDQANMPYGNYPAEGKTNFLRELILKDAVFLLSDRYWPSPDADMPRRDKPPVKAIVIACNTATSYGMNDVKRAVDEWKLDIPVVGVVDAGARGAVNAIYGKEENGDGNGGGTGAIAVLATHGTCQSEAYPEAIIKASGQSLTQRKTGQSRLEIIQQPCIGLAEAIEGKEGYISDGKRMSPYFGPSLCNMLAPLNPNLMDVYNFDPDGLIGDPEDPDSLQLNSIENYINFHVVTLVENYRQKKAEFPIKVVILGCTHYPLYREEILEAFQTLRHAEVDGEKPYENLIAEDIVVIDPSRQTAIFIYAALAKDGLLNEKNQSSDRERFRNQENAFFISVPNHMVEGAEISRNGEFTYKYKYGRPVGDFDKEYVKRVPLDLSLLPLETIQMIRKLPESWKEVMNFVT